MIKTQKIFQMLQISFGSLLVIGTIVSITASQLFAPLHFSSLGQQKTSLTAFLRAAVKLGDSYLIKQVFHDSLVTEYPVVFNSYLQENEWLQKLQTIELRSPQSRDILSAMSVLYSHMGDESQSKEYRNKIRSLDPTY